MRQYAQYETLPGDLPTEGSEAPLHAGIGAPESHAQPGMPQLDTTTYPSQIIWLAISFALMYFVISRHIFPRLADVVEMRKSKIAHDLEQAEWLRNEAENTRVQYDKSMQEARANSSQFIAKAHEKINKEALARNDALNETLAKQMHEAETRIAATRSKAMQKLAPVSADIAHDIVAKILGKSPDLKDINRIVDAAYKENT